MEAQVWSVARALRPVVALMLLATILFVAAGVLDGAYPGGTGWTAGPTLAASSYLFALVNLAFALVIARGSEWSLVGRIGLSLFFVVERTLSVFLLGPKSAASVAVHLATACVELVILVGAFRVWQLGRSYSAGDLDALFAIDGSPAAAAIRRDPDPVDPTAAGREPIRQATSWLLGLLSLALAGSLVGDGIRLGFVPGGREWGVTGDASGWLAYVFAVVLLSVATRAVHGGGLALRLLLAAALLFFIERAFSPVALRVLDPVSLLLHGLAVFLALALALATASAIRGSGRPGGHAASSPPL
ncbi:MAG TPA: hypothetical protein VIN34_05480 [Candidatus Limnocylindria bacterium]